MRRVLSPILFACVALLPASCGVVGDVSDILDQCPDACAKVEECSATPPDAVFGNLGKAETGAEGLDCALGCAAEDRELQGYSDCQIACIVGEECGAVQDCWVAKSEVYARWCLEDVEVPRIEPDPEVEPVPGNGTTTGNAEVDVIVTDPAVAIAVDECGGEEEHFPLNFGDSPPELVGRYAVSGTIDEQSNARPKGSPIETTICFWDYDPDAPGGVMVSYCEDGVPGEDAAPLTGTNTDFSVFFEYPGQATVLFSGAIDEDGTLSKVEALVVYTYTTDVWELSHTDWTPLDEVCTSCTQ
jgi:hypothetical protein